MSDKKDFFKRKEANKAELPTPGEYDVTNFDNDMNACGITDIEGFRKRHDLLFSNLIVDSDQENPVATIAKRIEETFIPREIAFLMSKDLLQTAYEQSVEELKKSN